MSTFRDWLKRAYKRWTRSQQGEEDFLGFCAHVGYPPVTVLSWINGESLPNDAELLSLAGTLGMDVYAVLGKPEPDQELIAIFQSFSQLPGEDRGKLAYALWEAQEEMEQKQVLAKSEEGKDILAKAFRKWGFEATDPYIG